MHRCIVKFVRAAYGTFIAAVVFTAIGISLVFMFSTPATAATVTFSLGDHPDSGLFQGDPTSPYGLRVDEQPPGGNGPTFSVGTNLGGLGGPMTISWDPTNLAAGATITGTMERNDDGTFWTTTYTLSGLSAAEDGGFKATDGSGSVDEIGGLLRSFSLTSEQNGSGIAFEFDNDGHRLATDDGWVGRGWLLPPDSTDDWIFTATLVPVPAAVWLFGSALGLLGWVRRKAA